MNNDDLSEMLKQPTIPLFHDEGAGTWTKAASVANNVWGTKFKYKERNEFMKKYDTGWFKMPIHRYPNNISEVAGGHEAEEPQRQYQTLNFSKYIPINTVYRLEATGSDMQLEGFVNQFMIFVYTGSVDTAPLIEGSIDVYYKDA